LPATPGAARRRLWRVHDGDRHARDHRPGDAGGLRRLYPDIPGTRKFLLLRGAAGRSDQAPLHRGLLFTSRPDRTAVGIDTQSHQSHPMSCDVRRFSQCNPDVPARGNAEKVARPLRRSIRQFPRHLAPGFSDCGMNRVYFSRLQNHADGMNCHSIASKMNDPPASTV